MSSGLHQRLRAGADALQTNYDARTRRTDWLPPVKDVMALARSNRIAPSALAAMGERSVEGCSDCWASRRPTAKGSTASYTRSSKPPEWSLPGLRRPEEHGERAAFGEDALEKCSRGSLAWTDWVRLQKLAPGKTARSAVAPLVEVAERVRFHPRLHQHIADFVRAVYEAAKTGLDAYADWKQQRRVVDFADMVDRAITLVDHADVARAGGPTGTAGRRRVPGHEPAAALALRQAAPARWALDVVRRSQAVHLEFTGADPTLMEAMTNWARSAGGATEQLPKNWRSRPELVDACNQLFSAAFAQHGYAAAEVEVRAERSTPPRLAELPALGLWQLEPPKHYKPEEALAEGLKRLLESPEETPVVDWRTGEVRNLRGSDIAVLLATNAELERVATELARRGVRSAIARAGLLGTPEGTLVDAALRRLIDPGDSLAGAVVEALTGFNGREPNGWLDARIADVAAQRAARSASEESQDAAADRHRPDSVDHPLAELLSPTEAVDHVIAHLDLASLCTRWPDPEQRRGNLEALRALAVEYEDRCAQLREAGTVAGLLRYFHDATEEVAARDEMRANDEQHVGNGPDAVTLVTYHRAKGLEWPVVVLGSLDRSARRSVFDVCPESDRETFDAMDSSPIAGSATGPGRSASSRKRIWPTPPTPARTVRGSRPASTASASDSCTSVSRGRATT